MRKIIGLAVLACLLSAGAGAQYARTVAGVTQATSGPAVWGTAVYYQVDSDSPLTPQQLSVFYASKGAHLTAVTQNKNGRWVSYLLRVTP